jgi:hypothetical protein
MWEPLCRDKERLHGCKMLARGRVYFIAGKNVCGK